MTIFSSPETRFAPTLLGGGKSKSIGNGCSAGNGPVTFVVPAKRPCDVVPGVWPTHSTLLLLLLVLLLRPLRPPPRGGEAFG